MMTQAKLEDCEKHAMVYLCCMWAQLRDREDGKGDTPVDETPKDDVGETETSVPN